VTFSVLSTSKSGFVAGITITNTGATAIDNWVLQFNSPATISKIWNATIVGHDKAHYIIQNVGNNRTIAPGQSITIGLLGSPGSKPAPPTNIVLGPRSSQMRFISARIRQLVASRS
jgi:hypothetical protein